MHVTGNVPTRGSSAARGLRAALVVVALTVALAACGRSAPSGEPGQGYVAGDGSTTILAPADRGEPVSARGTTLDGAPLALQNLRGSVVVVNLWASWCAPCRAEAPVLERVSQEMQARGVRFVGVVSGGKDSLDNARAFARRYGVTYPSLYDGDNQVVLAFKGQLPMAAIPTTVVLDRQGRVAARALGQVDRSRLLGLIEPVLAESPSSPSR